MKAISIRQPWCWFILHLPDFCRKDVENRDWQYLCRERGNILVHAAKGMTQTEFDDACEFALAAGATLLPRFEDLHRGGIVGMVRITGHVKQHRSRWFTGPTALVLADPYPTPFVPYPGQLGFFEVKDIHNPPLTSRERFSVDSKQAVNLGS